MPILTGSNQYAIGPGRVIVDSIAFSEQGGAKSYVGTIAIPAGSVVVNVVVHNSVLWTNGTSASIVIGDDDDANGYVEATDLKSAPTADTNGAGQGLSTLLSLGASCGVYKGGAGKYCATAKTLTATVTTGAGAQTDGRTRVEVFYVFPGASQTPVGV